MTSTERSQQVREKRRAQGLCTRCGQVPVKLLSWCGLCREFDNERRRNNAKLKQQVRDAMRRQNRRRRVAGLCIACRIPSATFRCAECANTAAERNAAHRARKREAGLCVNCPEPSASYRCHGCAAKCNAAARAATRAEQRVFYPERHQP